MIAKQTTRYTLPMITEEERERRREIGRKNMEAMRKQRE